jgi:hypothetical protein
MTNHKSDVVTMTTPLANSMVMLCSSIRARGQSWIRSRAELCELSNEFVDWRAPTP